MKATELQTVGRVGTGNVSPSEPRPERGPVGIGSPWQNSESPAVSRIDVRHHHLEKGLIELLTNRQVRGLETEERMSRAAVPSMSDVALTSELDGLFRDHHQLIYRTAYSLTGSRHDAEDVLQTVFLRLLRRGLPVGFSQNPQGYLYRAAVNLSLNVVRTRKRQHLVDGVERLLVPVPPAGPSSDAGLQRCLLAAIARLKPRAVEILILHYEHDYSDAEIAKMLGTSRGTIAVSLYRARARLKKLMHAISGGKS
jgi:RNA polymerase sigma factor (sigma-70 family)